MANSKPKDEKYTPLKYIHAVKQVLGEIELDPASCEAANLRVKAKKFYSKEDNGLDKVWLGKTFLNPPYSTGNLIPFTTTLIQSHKVDDVSEAILLTPNWTERKWFQPLWNYIICFTDHRIDFIDGATGKLCGNPEGGSCFTYFPDMNNYDLSVERFIKVFSKFGHIVDGMSALVLNK